MGRPSTLLTHPQLPKITAALRAGEPVATIAKRFHVSVPAIYRYKSSAYVRATAEAAQAESATAADIVGTLSASLRDIDGIRRTAVALGRTAEALRAAQTVNQLSGTLAKSLGIDSTETAAQLVQGEAVLSALATLTKETPEIAQRMAKALDAADERELAGEFESVHKLLTSEKQES